MFTFDSGDQQTHHVSIFRQPDSVQEGHAHCCCPRFPGSYPLSALSEADTSSYASELAKLLPSSTDEEEPTLEEDVQEEGDVQEKGEVQEE